MTEASFCTSPKCMAAGFRVDGAPLKFFRHVTMGVPPLTTTPSTNCCNPLFNLCCRSSEYMEIFNKVLQATHALYMNPLRPIMALWDPEVRLKHA